MNNLEIAKLYKRISLLENINNVKNNDDHYTYEIDDFGIICPDYGLPEISIKYFSELASIIILS